MSTTPARLLRLLALLFSFTLLAAACGDDDDAADDPDTEQAADDGGTDDDADDGDDDEGSGDVPDPCGLVTPADLQTFFGSPFDEGELTDNVEQIGTMQCTWSNTDAPPVKVISLAIGTDAAQRDAFDRGAEELFGLTRTAAEDSDSILEADLGLGDESYRTEGAIYVLDGDRSYSFLSTGSSDEAVAGLKQMATQVIGD